MIIHFELVQFQVSGLSGTFTAHDIDNIDLGWIVSKLRDYFSECHKIEDKYHILVNASDTKYPITKYAEYIDNQKFVRFVCRVTDKDEHRAMQLYTASNLILTYVTEITW